MKTERILLIVGIIVVLAYALISQSPAKDIDSTVASYIARPGTLELRATAETSNDLKELSFTIARIDISVDGQTWSPILSGPKPIEVIQLKDKELVLASNNIAPGVYKFIRLEIIGVKSKDSQDRMTSLRITEPVFIVPCDIIVTSGQQIGKFIVFDVKDAVTKNYFTPTIYIK